MIDHYMPQYDYHEIHSKIIRAPIDKIYQNIRHLDFSASWISRLLFRIRGLNTDTLSLDTMVDKGSFFTVYEKENREWIIGLLADSFTMPAAQNTDQNFVDWNPGKGIKIAWNFLLQEINPGWVKVSTETRIRCLNTKAKYLFSVYWLFVRPFSGLIRLEMLRILKNKCEI